jgi:hypothetical protein
VSSADGDVRARADDVVGSPGGLLGFLPDVHVHAEAVTSSESGVVAEVDP